MHAYRGGDNAEIQREGEIRYMGTQINVSGRYNWLLKQLADRVRAMGHCAAIEVC